MIWTDEAVEELKKMWERGMTTGQIAKALNVTKNSIIGKVHRLCLTARPSPIKKAVTPKTEDGKNKVKTTKKEKRSVKEKAQTSKEKEVGKSVAQTVNENKTVNETCQSCETVHIPLVKLDNHTCRWPLGDPRDEDFCFCGKKIKTGQTYCEEHAAIAYVKPGKKF